MRPQLLLSITPMRTALHLIGEFDVAQRVALRGRIDQALTLCGRDLEVDASKVTFVDCGTLRELERAQHELARRGGRLVVPVASPTFRRVAILADYPDLLPDAGAETGQLRQPAASRAVRARRGHAPR